MDESLDAYREPRRGLRLGVGAAIVVAVAVAAVVIGMAVWRGATAPVEVVAGDGTTGTAEGSGDEPLPEVTVEPGDLYVHVFGAVHEPGLYLLPPGARVVDAITAAGGLSDEAAAEGVNLARPLSDGEHLGVPTEEEVEAAGPSAPGGSAGGQGGADAAAVVDLNTADLSELETLPGIGPALAERIVSWREENGRFGSVDDLLAVSGIGPKVLEGLRDQVRV